MAIVAEQWKQIEGFEGRYEVSDTGRVRSITRKNIIYRKPVTNAGGYLKVQLRKGGKVRGFYVHRLVAAAFIGIPDGMTVNHLDGDKANNRVENLEVCTRGENSKHGYRTGLIGLGENHINSKLKESQIPDIKRRIAAGESERSIASRYGVARSSIRHIKAGRSWAHV